MYPNLDKAIYKLNTRFRKVGILNTNFNSQIEGKLSAIMKVLCIS